MCFTGQQFLFFQDKMNVVPSVSSAQGTDWLSFRRLQHHTYSFVLILVSFVHRTFIVITRTFLSALNMSSEERQSSRVSQRCHSTHTHSVHTHAQQSGLLKCVYFVAGLLTWLSDVNTRTRNEHSWLFLRQVKKDDVPRTSTHLI